VCVCVCVAKYLQSRKLRLKSREYPLRQEVLELGVRWYTVVYILDVFIECLPRVS
jgi:hypothetical protein